MLTDLAMPVMDGAATLEAVRARYPSLPVIVMSGSFDPGTERLPAGVTGFLAKPFPLEQLLTAIADALRAKPG